MRRAGPLLMLSVLVATLTCTVLTIPARAAAFAPGCAPGAGSGAENSPAAGTPAQTPWAQARLGADRLPVIATGAGIVVAVIDSGVDGTHRAVGKVIGGGDLLDTAGDGRLDCVGHGTAVASLINGGFHGLAPQATVLSVRVTEQEEVDGTTVGRTAGSAGLADAIRRSVDEGAQVINLSLVSYTDNPRVRAAVAYAVSSDVVVVAAVGNRAAEGNPTPYPAAYDGVLGVGAIGLDSRRLAGSQVGPYVDLVAPGAQILAAGLPDGFTVHEGTSFATPFVAAAAALVRQYRPNLTAAQVASRLLATADPSPGGPHSPEYGAGLVNPYRALTDQLGAPTGPARSTSPIAEKRASNGAAGDDHAQALTIAGVAVGLALLALLGAAIGPRGRRRRWRPGTPKLPTAAELNTPDPAAPAFGDPLHAGDTKPANR